MPKLNLLPAQQCDGLNQADLTLCTERQVSCEMSGDVLEEGEEASEDAIELNCYLLRTPTPPWF